MYERMCAVLGVVIIDSDGDKVQKNSSLVRLLAACKDMSINMYRI